MGERTCVQLGRRGVWAPTARTASDYAAGHFPFAKSADFAFGKPEGDPYTNLDDGDACSIHPHLRDRGFKGCTVFDGFGAGQTSMK